MSAPTLVSAFGTQLDQLDKAPLQPVDVAILDSGIDATHPDLAGRVVEAYHFRSEGETVVRADIPAGRNNDTYGHGTGVASIVARYAPHARLYDLRVLEPQNMGKTACVVAALRFALERGWRILNLSLAVQPKFIPQLLPLCERAYYQNQILVAARHNFPMPDNPGYPAALASTIGIEIGPFDSPFRFVFNDGGTMEFGALGENITVASVGGGYTVKNGTSFATPVISALCALIVGAYPELALRPFEIKTLLKRFAQPMPKS
jgi:subtilisin